MTKKEMARLAMQGALVATVSVAGLVYSGITHAAPTAWGQPMPAQCTTRFEWKSPNAFPVHVYDAAGCAQPWAANAVTFFKGIANWLREQSNERPAS